ncbi:hypothetical protein Pelo_10864 [Pelomyxa schiedti]|nr:hypothetical protein Pelo_10864 [Pelomyxa schiedti]
MQGPGLQEVLANQNKIIAKLDSILHVLWGMWERKRQKAEHKKHVIDEEKSFDSLLAGVFDQVTFLQSTMNQPPLERPPNSPLSLGGHQQLVVTPISPLRNVATSASRYSSACLDSHLPPMHPSLPDAAIKNEKGRNEVSTSGAIQQASLNGTQCQVQQQPSQAQTNKAIPNSQRNEDNTANSNKPVLDYSQRQPSTQFSLQLQELRNQAQHNVMAQGKKLQNVMTNVVLDICPAIEQTDPCQQAQFVKSIWDFLYNGAANIVDQHRKGQCPGGDVVRIWVNSVTSKLRGLSIKQQVMVTEMCELIFNLCLSTVERPGYSFTCSLPDVIYNPKEMELFPSQEVPTSPGKVMLCVIPGLQYYGNFFMSGETDNNIQLVVQTQYTIMESLQQVLRLVVGVLAIKKRKVERRIAAAGQLDDIAALVLAAETQVTKLQDNIQLLSSSPRAAATTIPQGCPADDLIQRQKRRQQQQQQQQREQTGVEATPSHMMQAPQVTPTGTGFTPQKGVQAAASTCSSPPVDPSRVSPGRGLRNSEAYPQYQAQYQYQNHTTSPNAYPNQNQNQNQNLIHHHHRRKIAEDSSGQEMSVDGNTQKDVDCVGISNNTKSQPPPERVDQLPPQNGPRANQQPGIQHQNPVRPLANSPQPPLSARIQKNAVSPAQNRPVRGIPYQPHEITTLLKSFQNNLTNLLADALPFSSITEPMAQAKLFFKIWKYFSDAASHTPVMSEEQFDKKVSAALCLFVGLREKDYNHAKSICEAMLRIHLAFTQTSGYTLWAPQTGTTHFNTQKMEALPVHSNPTPQDYVAACAIPAVFYNRNLVFKAQVALNN